MTTTALSPWTDWDAKMKFADQLVRTGFLPKAVDTPGKALAIIFAGQEVGIPPMTALRSIDVIQGKPAMNSELKLAIFKAKGGRSKWIRSDDEAAEIWLRHPNGDEHTETFTIEDAKRAKLLHKDGWQHYPKAMLCARVISAGLRKVAPDITTGIYDPEELGADVTAEGEIVIPEPKPKRALVTIERTPTPPAIDLIPAENARAEVSERAAAFETEPESGRSEIPPRAPLDEWLEAFTRPTRLEALLQLWQGCTAPGVKETWSPAELKQLIAGKDAAKARILGLEAA